MVKHILFCLSLLFSSVVFSQQNDSLKEISINLSVKLDSIELLIRENKRGIDTALFFHITLRNQTDSIISVTTNSCPSYNQFEFSFDGNVYNPNSKVNCNLNEISTHQLKTKESMSIRVLGLMNLGTLTKRMGKTTFTIYFIENLNTRYQIFPRQEFTKGYYSTFKGEVEIVETKISYLKRKKRTRL